MQRRSGGLVSEGTEEQDVCWWIDDVWEDDHHLSVTGMVYGDNARGKGDGGHDQPATF